MVCTLAGFLLWDSPSTKEALRILKVSIQNPELPRYSTSSKTEKKRRLPPLLSFMEFDLLNANLKLCIGITEFIAGKETGGARIQAPPDGGKGKFWHNVRREWVSSRPDREETQAGASDAQRVGGGLVCAFLYLSRRSCRGLRAWSRAGRAGGGRGWGRRGLALPACSREYPGMPTSSSEGRGSAYSKDLVSSTLTRKPFDVCALGKCVPAFLVSLFS